MSSRRPGRRPPEGPWGWDLCGSMLADHLAGDRAAAATWTLEDGEALELPAAVFFRDEEEMPPAEELALDLCRGRVLDAGAGAGAHALALQERGLEVTAIDAAAAAVEVMRRRGVERALRDDLFAHHGGPYDTLLLMMNGIGVVGDLAGLDRLFALFALLPRLLAAGGQVLLDSSDLADSDNPREPARIAAREAAGRYRGEAVVTLAYRGVVAAPNPWLFLDRRTLARRARAHGWRSQVVFQGAEGEFLARLTRGQRPKAASASDPSPSPGDP